jgi:hypothetical protein
MAKGRQKKQATKKVNFDGNKYELAILSPGRQPSDDDKVAIASLVCKMYASNRVTIASCLKKCGISSSSTWHKWTSENEEIEKLYLKAREIRANTRRDELREIALDMTERLIKGYTYKALEETFEPVPDLSGGETLKKVKVVEKDVFVKPSIVLIRDLIFNDPANKLKRNPDQFILPDTITDIEPAVWVDGNGFDEQQPADNAD